MRKLFFIMLAIALSTSSLFADQYEDALKSFVKGGGFLAGVFGQGIVHGLFAIPLVLGIAIAVLIIGFYFWQFQQKDRGLGKTVGAVFIALGLGVATYISTLSVLDGVFPDGKEGCAKKVVKSYISDAVVAGFAPITGSGYQWGTGIIATGCFSQ